MLNETAITRTEPRVQAWSLQSLLRFIAALAALFAIGCLYFSQVNEIATIRGETGTLQARAQELERENVAMMVQMAALTTPGNVQQKAVELGLTTVAQPDYVAVPVDPLAAPESPNSSDLVVLWQRLVTAVGDRWPVH